MLLNQAEASAKLLIWLWHTLRLALSRRELDEVFTWTIFERGFAEKSKKGSIRGSAWSFC